MTNKAQAQATVTTAPLTRSARFGQWVQEPMNSIIAASAATMSTLGLVLSGMWFISYAMN